MPFLPLICTKISEICLIHKCGGIIHATSENIVGDVFDDSKLNRFGFCLNVAGVIKSVCPPSLVFIINSHSPSTVIICTTDALAKHREKPGWILSTGLRSNWDKSKFLALVAHKARRISMCHTGMSSRTVHWLANQLENQIISTRDWPTKTISSITHLTLFWAFIDLTLSKSINC